jgi:hypothetical protein
MKRYVALILCLFSSLSASPVGNAAAPELIEQGFFIPNCWWGNVRLGYEGDFVSDGKMEQYAQGYGKVDSYEQQTNSGVITFNILERIDLFTVLGASRTNADWRFVDQLNGVHRIEMETNYGFLWGVGARGILYEEEDICLTLGGRFETSYYMPSWLTLDGVPQPVSRGSLEWNQWQIDLDFSYTIDIFAPYIGVKYSHARSELNGFLYPISSKGTSNQFKNRIPMGIVIGCGLSSGKYFMLNLEGRLIDEEAVTVSGDIRF